MSEDAPYLADTASLETQIPELASVIAALDEVASRTDPPQGALIQIALGYVQQGLDLLVDIAGA